MEDIFRKCIVKWGADAQMRMCMEEAGEFITAIAKFGRKINGTTLQQLAEETADLEIMLRQLRFIIDTTDISKDGLKNFNDMVEDVKKYKLDRLKGMLEDV